MRGGPRQQTPEAVQRGPAQADRKHDRHHRPHRIGQPETVRAEDERGRQRHLRDPHGPQRPERFEIPALPQAQRNPRDGSAQQAEQYREGEQGQDQSGHAWTGEGGARYITRHLADPTRKKFGIQACPLSTGIVSACLR